MILLAAVLAAVGGTVVWLELSEPPVPHAKPGTRISLDGGTAATAGGGHGAAATGHAPSPPTADVQAAKPGQPEPAHPAPARSEGEGSGTERHAAPGETHAPAPSGHGSVPRPDAHAPVAPASPPAAPPAAHGAPPASADVHGAKPAGNGQGGTSEAPANPPPSDDTQTAARTVAPKPLPRVRPDPPLQPAPDPALVQESTLGPLPRVGDDGRKPWQVYAKPFGGADGRPLIAIVISGLGLSAAATESAIQGLPGGVTLAFAPYGNDLNGWIRLARAAGHEVLLNVPMEPLNYPAYDPGPQTLLTTLNAQGNLDRLMWILSRGTGYVGVIDYQGSRFTASRAHLAPVMAALRERGLLFLDSGSAARATSESIATEIGMPWAIATLTLDDRASRVDIDRKFAELERIARRDKRAIGVGSAYPVTLERVQNWTRQLEARGFAIAPVSAIAAMPKGKTEARQ
jgi:polysaccharide deacetylase 2 family uncharacterized protein YibQ